MNEVAPVVFLQIGSPEFNELIKTVRSETRITTIEEIKKSQEQSFFNTAEVKKILGCSDRTLYTLRTKGNLKSFRSGAQYKYDKQSVLDWCEKKSKS
jgi:excisionase family DNA binding protein